MNNPRKNVQDMIRRRQEKNKKIREKITDGRTDVEVRVVRFLEEFDTEFKRATDALDKHHTIDIESNKLINDLHFIDPQCSIELVWFGDDEESMRLSGIRVIWGEKYKEEKGISYDDTLFDVSDILFK